MWFYQLRMVGNVNLAEGWTPQRWVELFSGLTFRPEDQRDALSAPLATEEKRAAEHEKQC